MILDELSLDAMVCGEEVNLKAWQTLLLDPDRESIWQDAVTRREQLNSFCSLAASWPDLAKTYLKLKKLTRVASQSPLLSCLYDVDPHLPFAAVMGKEDTDDHEHLISNIQWGQQQIIDMEVPGKIKFQTTQRVHIHYEYRLGSGWISSDDFWDFIVSEGAVLLTFCDAGNRTSEKIELVIEQSESVASIVLMPT